jgi:glycosyltransferase involved in cell wall biosynthesis
MKILLVSHHFPSDPDKHVSGVFRRFGMFVEAFRALGKLDMLFFVPSFIPTDAASVARFRERLSDHWQSDISLTLCPQAPTPDPPSRWQAYGPGTLSLLKQLDYLCTSGEEQVHAFGTALARKPDAIFAHRLQAMCPILRRRGPLPPVYLDLDDIEHVARYRNLREPPTWLGRRLYYLHLPAMFAAEVRAMGRARRTFVCSDTDRRYLARTLRRSGVVTVPNAVEVHMPLDVTQQPTLLFIGTLNYLPNVNAATLLLDEIFPRVRQEVPNARLLIAGPHPEALLNSRPPDPNVEFTGFAADLDELYRESRVVCVPVRSGGGTRVKIVEAAAYGKPVVSTRLGVEGLRFEDGRDLLVRDDVEGFSRACIDLLNDADACRSLGQSAHRVAAQCYERGSIVAAIRDEIRRAQR